MKRVYPVALLIISLLLWIILIQKEERTTRPGSLLFQELRGVRINTETSKGEYWTLEASLAIIDNNDMATIYDVTFRSESRNISFKAPIGIYEITTGNSEIMDGVIIKLPDGSIGKIDSLRIERGRIKSDDPVVLEKDGMKITGKGIVTDESGNLKIAKDVRVEFK